MRLPENHRALALSPTRCTDQDQVLVGPSRSRHANRAERDGKYLREQSVFQDSRPKVRSSSRHFDYLPGLDLAGHRVSEHSRASWKASVRYAVRRKRLVG